jgi:hypothetical protein
MKDLHKLEQNVLGASRCYADSTAFRKALDYIKKTDMALYASLLEIEGEECGCIEL